MTSRLATHRPRRRQLGSDPGSEVLRAARLPACRVAAESPRRPGRGPLRSSPFVRYEKAMGDKVLLVTGGSRGIGAATARLARGYDVCVNFRADRDAAESVVADVRKQ